MLTDAELIRRKLSGGVHAMTITLLLNSEDKKTGKIAGRAAWSDPSKTSPFTFYQYWRSVGDQGVLECPRMLTFLPLLQTDEMNRWEGTKLNGVKNILAYEPTMLVHGEKKVKKACENTQALFTGDGALTHAPTVGLMNEDFNGGKADILTLLVKSGLAASRSETKHDIQQGDVSLGGESIKDIAANYDADFFVGEGKLLKHDKKNFVKLVRA